MPPPRSADLPAAPRAQGMAARPGFTLFELLVVITIIAILVAILVPSTALVRAQARSLLCLQSLRALHQATLVYSTDNDGYLPPSSTFKNWAAGWDPASANKWEWMDLLGPLLGGPDENYRLQLTTHADGARKGAIWGCPEWRSHLNGSGAPSSTLTGYAKHNEVRLVASSASPDGADDRVWEAVSAGQAPVYFHLAEAGRFASLRPLFGDGMSWHFCSSTTSASAADRDYTRHRGRANYLFFDGHGRSLPPADAQLAIDDPAHFSE